MPLTISGREIRRVWIIEDDPYARESYAYPLEELGALPMPANDMPMNSADEFVHSLDQQSDAVLCDYHLGKRNYATFNGDAIVAGCYGLHIPAVLCTRFPEDVDCLRRLRRSIPSLIRPEDLEPETIRRGFHSCIGEFNEHFEPHRKPFRTLVRIEEVDLDGPIGLVYIVLPGRKPKEVLKLTLDNLPEDIRPLVEPGRRLHAHVNIGASQHDELYFEAWEPE